MVTAIPGRQYTGGIKKSPARSPAMTEQADLYQIQVRGQLDASWSVWFSGFTITPADGPDAQPLTTLSGPIADQAALRGILNRVWDLNLIVVSVICLSETSTVPDEK
jgi:hypothetical protein